MTKERIIFLDWLRAIACLMVMTIHACECIYSNDYSFSFPEETSRWSILLISGLMRPAVPLFLMASAFLLVPMKTVDRDGNPVGALSFFKRRFTRVAIPFVVWLVLYATLPAAWGEWSWTESLENLKTVWINFHPRCSHLWFIYMLLGIYLIIPVISPWLEKVSRREEEVYLSIWLFTSLSWHLHEYVGDVVGECWWNPYPTLYYVSGFVGYILMAHYIRTYLDWNWRKTLSVALPCFIVGFVFCAAWFYYQSFRTEEVRVLELSWQGTSIAPVIMSFGAFMLIKKISLGSGKVYDAIRSLSAMSYGMYLMHMMMLPAIFSIFNSMNLPAPLLIFSTALCTYLGSYILTWLISKLPFGKYIVG